MKTKTNIKAGNVAYNHNETLVRRAVKQGMKVKTQIKSGCHGANHNETLVRV
jgi:hypothetical protein